MTYERDTGLGTRRSPSKWRRCTWPHQLMSAAEHVEMNALLTKWRPWIAARARGMAGLNEQLRDELVQRGLITLWQLGTRRVASHARGLIRTIVKRRMLNQLEAEIRGIQRNGERLLPFI